MSSEKIQALTQDAKEVIDKFDFSNSFYDIYKNPDTYKKLAEEWNKNHQNIKVNV
jgi:ribosome biogenesis protein Tsr3